MSSDTPNTPPSSSVPPRTTGGNWRWTPPSPADLQALLPNYEIEALLGHGGMGAVYKGIQKGLDRPVAIKILPPGIEKEDPTFADRFKNEAKLMARLMHPAIVTVFEFGQTPAGQLYFVMEFVDGTDIHHMLRAAPGGRLPPEHALAITAHVCDALTYAHTHGVVHRDIKPANILINSEGQVKVADFGLAKLDDPGERGFTQTGMAMGTPDYVAPEALVLGTAIDGRADLYAVGVMLYQMLTGEVPRGLFKPASVRVPGLDKRFDAIVEKAMQTDREERYPTSAALRADLDQLMFQPVSAAQLQQFTTGMVRQAVPVKEGKSAPPGSAKPARQASASSQPHEAPVKSKTPIHIGISVATALGVAALAFFGPVGGGKKKPEDPPPPPPAGGLSEAAQPGSKTPATASAPKSSPPPPRPVPALSPPAATPAEPQFPPGKWVKVFTKFEDLPKELQSPALGLKVEQGWIRLGKQKRTVQLPSILNTNYAVRASFLRHGEDTQFTRIIARDTGRSGDFYQAVFLNSLTIQKHEGENWNTIKAASAPPIAAGQQYLLEFGVVGKRLVARSGSAFATVTDSRYTQGSARIFGTEDMRDIEVINLDGLPEAEALRILGVDENGNDLRATAVAGRAAGPPATASGSAMTDAGNAPATPNAALGGPSALPTGNASSSPSFPVSQSSDPPFPPGQWVRLDGTESLALLPRTEESWIEPLANFKELDFLRGKNQGIRFLSRVSAATSGDAHMLGVRSRINQDKDFTRYQLILSAGSGSFSIRRNEGNAATAPILKSLSKLSIQPGMELQMEFAAVGDRLIARVNGQLESVVQDSMYEDGYLAFRNVFPIRDIEVINLDGLPEAESLRILGVDEKGNDLRALAAQQEQQKAEMAKQADAMAAIPELKALHEQFVKLQGERVNAPFEKDVAALNTSYLGGLDRKIAEMKQKGDLDGVLALEAEKALVAGQQPVPAEEDDTTTATLKDLRKIYREAHAKLEATRAANLKLLTDPLDTRLKQLETDLTRKDRVDHAKTVREYREGLGRAAGPPAAASGPAAANPPGAALGGPSALPPAKYPKGDDRKAAEWVLSLGGAANLTISGPGTPTTIVRKIEDLPKGNFTISKIDLAFSSLSSPPQVPIANLDVLTGLQELEFLRLSGTIFTDSMLGILPSLPKLSELRLVETAHTDNAIEFIKACKRLQALMIENNKSFTGSRLGELTPLKLSNFNLNTTGVDGSKLKAMESWSQLASLTLRYHDFRDEDMRAFSRLDKLESLHLQRAGVTFAGLIHFENSRQLASLYLLPPPDPPTPEFLRVVDLFPKLSVYRMEGPCTRSQTAALAAFRNLETVEMQRVETSEEAVLGVLDLPRLKSLRLMNKGGENITPEAIKQLAAHKSLERIISDGLPLLTDDALMALADMRQLKELELGPTPKLTAAGIDAFKKKRPEVKLTR